MLEMYSNVVQFIEKLPHISVLYNLHSTPPKAARVSKRFYTQKPPVEFNTFN